MHGTRSECLTEATLVCGSQTCRHGACWQICGRELAYKNAAHTLSMTLHSRFLHLLQPFKNRHGRCHARKVQRSWVGDAFTYTCPRSPRINPFMHAKAQRAHTDMARMIGSEVDLFKALRNKYIDESTLTHQKQSLPGNPPQSSGVNSPVCGLCCPPFCVYPGRCPGKVTTVGTGKSGSS